MPPRSSPPLLVLIGFMGAGKSTLGRLLALHLGCPFFDLDAEIARIHGPIPELFSSRGESGFRAIEHHQLDLLLPKLTRPSVLALGGGAFLQPANRELLAMYSATIIFLDASFETVHARISHTGNERPLARDLGWLCHLYEQRRPIYQLAHYTFPANSSDPAPLLARLVQLANDLGATAMPRATL